MSIKYDFVNDSFIDSAKASLHVSDLSIQRGYGIFDFFKTINNKPIFLQDHLERFYNSAAKMHLHPPVKPSELEQVLKELIHKNNLPDSGIRITLTGGYSADGYTLPETPNLIITQHPLTLPVEFNPKGISLITYNYQRPLPEMKTLDYSMAVWLQPLIRAEGNDDVLYHENGLIRECPRANFFIVTKENEVITSSEKTLKGVIRKNILNLENSGFRLTEKDITLDDLKNASEAFITSTTKNILPVLRINQENVGTGKAGEVSRKLAGLLLEKVKQQLITNQ